MNKLTFLTELLNRLKSRSPKFFVRLQIAAGVLFGIAAICKWVLPRYGIVIPDTLLTLAGDIIDVTITTGVVSQFADAGKPAEQSPA